MDKMEGLHWDLVPLQPSKSTIGFHWVYKIKTKFYDLIKWYKTWLDANGLSQ